MAGKRYTFVLNFGYAESAHMGFVPFVSKNTYGDAKEALLDLAVFLRDEFLGYKKTDPKKCCVVTRTKDPDAKFCSKCGANLGEYGFDGEEFCDWLNGLDIDTDTYNGCIEWDPDKRWQAGQLEGSPNQRFVYQAEWVLAAAVGYSHQAHIAWDEICKERTKSKKTSFSYY